MVALLALAIPVSAAQDDLSTLRAQRRASVRAAALAKADGGAPFGLLVIPIDFADARFADPPDLTARLTADAPGSLVHYYDTASQGRTRLRVVMAPLISLSGDRLDYSDLDLQGFSRTRRMASEALAAAAGLGTAFADADADGDGEVDGVLLLHAAPGLENDPEGLIVPLQYFLDEAVVQNGVVARMYAVGAARSPLGLWAHETGHLLGLNDRYDTQMPSGGETTPRGGLGRFSLMSVGWQGSGGGTDPALPDAYSRLELGWVDQALSLDQGVVKLRGTDVGRDTWYFLVERRDAAATAPYDAGLDPDQALVYRIRGDIPDGVVDTDHPSRQQRVQLVEADGGSELANGLDQGVSADLFPSQGDHQDFNDVSVPWSRFFDAIESGVAATFTVTDGLVSVADLAARPAADVHLSFPANGASGEVWLRARVDSGQTMPGQLVVRFDHDEVAWGHFENGDTSHVVALAPTQDGWFNYASAEPLTWVQDDVAPEGAVTRFWITVLEGASGGAAFDHPWRDAGPSLDLADSWPDQWVSDLDTWQLWSDLPGAAWPTPPYLVALPASQTSQQWPEVQYANGADTWVRSPVLGPAVRWVRLNHTLNAEMLRPGVTVDAATLTWVDPNGRRVAAEPVDGWPALCSSRAGHDLAGSPAFAGTDSLRAGGVPEWHPEVVVVPEADRWGPGPWKLEFAFASNAVWRGRGWMVRDLATSLDDPPTSAFAIWREDDRLRWSAPVGATPTSYDVERRADDQEIWRTVAAGLPADSLAVDLASVGATGGKLWRLRVVAQAGHPLLSRTLLVAGTGGELALGAPRPNPARDQVALSYDATGAATAELTVHDLRGRKVRRWSVAGAPGMVTWDGRDGRGRRVAAGVYIVRLNADGRTRTTKMTWMH